VAAQLGLTIEGRLAGGEHGALAAVDADGRPIVLKLFPVGRAARLAAALEVAAAVRARGVPVPDPYRSGVTADAAFTLQRRCRGEVPVVFGDEHAVQMLEFWEHHQGAMSDDGEWPLAVVAALRRGDPDLDADHGPIRAAGGPAAALLDELVTLGADADPSVLSSTDAMHGDWHHHNVLVDGARVTTVFDWEAARAGDARGDLLYLAFWASVYAGTEVAEDATARLRAAVEARVEPAARRVLAGLIALQQLWFVAAHRPHRLAGMVERVERHLAPQWRR
jgi:Ser/Thr protein kinase RdoA (MazF antagonist)